MSKKFKDTTVGQILFGAASAINPTLGSVLKGVTSPKEAIELGSNYLVIGRSITASDTPNEILRKLVTEL